MSNISFLFAQAGDGGVGAIVLLLICVGVCWAVNQVPTKKIETFVGQKTTEYKK